MSLRLLMEKFHRKLDRYLGDELDSRLEAVGNSLRSSLLDTARQEVVKVAEQLAPALQSEASCLDCEKQEQLCNEKTFQREVVMLAEPPTESVARRFSQGVQSCEMLDAGKGVSEAALCGGDAGSPQRTTPHGLDNPFTEAGDFPQGPVLRISRPFVSTLGQEVLGLGHGTATDGSVSKQTFQVAELPPEGSVPSLSPERHPSAFLGDKPEAPQRGIHGPMVVGKAREDALGGEGLSALHPGMIQLSERPLSEPIVADTKLEVDGVFPAGGHQQGELSHPRADDAPGARSRYRVPDSPGHTATPARS